MSWRCQTRLKGAEVEALWKGEKGTVAKKAEPKVSTERRTRAKVGAIAETETDIVAKEDTVAVAVVGGAEVEARVASLKMVHQITQLKR